MINTLTTKQVDSLIAGLKHRYGKLWPLQTFNACNPLLAYEYLPFNQALRQAEIDMCFSSRRAMGVFKSLFEKQIFTQRDVHNVLESHSDKIFQKDLPIKSRVLTYRQILEKELLFNLTHLDLDSNSAFWFTEKGQRLNTLIQNHIKEKQGKLPSLVSYDQMLWINEQVSKWLAAYLDEGQSLWQMPGKEKAFRLAWSDLIIHDNQLNRSIQRQLQQLVLKYISPEKTTLESLTYLLNTASIYVDQVEYLLDLHLKELPGWVGYIQYCQQSKKSHEDLLIDYLLVRLLYHFASDKHYERQKDHFSNGEVRELLYRFDVLRQVDIFNGMQSDDSTEVLLENFNQWIDYIESFPLYEQLLILIKALENYQRLPLLQVLNRAHFQHNTSKKQIHSEPDAQAVFCIDVRSEPYRKALESSGNIETYGFAGFFGLPIAKVAYASQEAVPLCPILLEPKLIIPECPSQFGKTNMVSKLIRGAIPLRQQWIYSLKKIKRDIFATFAYVEGFGIVHALTFLKDSFAGVLSGQLSNKISKILLPLASLIPQLETTTTDEQSNSTGIALPTQVELAKTILPLIGLSEPFAEFVIICGHAAKTKNNPYASALDCGACGANGGGFNALVLCQILNHPSVREALCVDGLHIPEHTRFVAAQHNTTTDDVSFLNLDIIPSQQQRNFIPIQEAFEKATRMNRTQRHQKLKVHAAVSYDNNNLIAAYDWSQTRPEWGLSQNQAFIIGEREVVKALDLEGRCFLHSYHWQSDPGGDVLKIIMTAPMVVGTWINLQYGFSTLDQHRFGSGKKYLHNIVGLFGSYLGNASDLQVGLPYESLFSNDGTPYHYPQRLLVYIQAPRERVDSIIEQHESVKNLVKNHWIKLVVFDPQKNLVYEHTENGWKLLNSEEETIISNPDEVVSVV